MKTTILISIFFATHFFAFTSYSQESKQINSPSSLEKFFQITQGLKEAVCDESYVSKAPSFSVDSSKSIQTGLVLEMESSKLSEHDLISFLMGEPSAVIKSEDLEASTANVDKSKVPELKRRQSLEFCEGLVSPNKLKELLQKKPKRFLVAVDTIKAEEFFLKKVSLLGAKKDSAIFMHLRDTESRAASFEIDSKNAILIPGWVESYEVEKVALFSKKKVQRLYQRIFHPLTNNTQSIVLLSPQDNVIGVFELGSTAQSRDLVSLKKEAESEKVRLKQIEIFKNLAENLALQKMTELSQQKKADETARRKIRDLQDFYRNLMSAYLLFPNEKQFEAYKKAQKSWSLEEVVQGLGDSFFNSLSKARVQENAVHLSLFLPDSKLEAIFAEYKKKLNTVK